VNCETIKKNIELYLDSELTLSDRRDFEEHITECDSCTKLLNSMQIIQNSVRNTEYINAPASLKQNIQNQLRDYTGEKSKKINWLQWLGFGSSSMAVGSFATWLLLSFIFISPVQLQLTDEIISSHVQSLMVDHMTDINSNDSHNVKPWFNGKLDFSPPVKNLESEGFTLMGGRLDYIQGKSVSALVYKRRKHIINTFIFKNNDNNPITSPQLIHRQGYNIFRWENNGLDYWIISDLNEKELNVFSQLILNDF
jgi:anti-sigma factor RsiW